MNKHRLGKLTLLWSAVIAFALTFCSALAFGQATTGSISGTVTDPNGAVVAGAQVTVTSQETGAQRGTTTNGEGVFSFLRLSPGKYTLRIENKGFRLAEVHDVVVSLALDTAVPVGLEVGSMQETVIVEGGGAPLVETTTAQTTSAFETKKIQDLPAVTGRLDTLALLAPGVIPGFGNVNSNGATLSVNGQRARSNNFTIDGQDNNDNSIGGPGLFLSDIEVVKEFSIVTNNFSAEFGRNQGAIVNIVTKSGTNDLHGSLFGYHQNSKFFANVFENNRDGIVKPRFNDNIDGGAVGGPFKRDKAFYFLNFRSEQSKSISTNTSTPTGRVITPNGLATLIGRCGATNTLAAYRDHGPFAQSIGNPTILPGSVALSTYTGLASADPCGATGTTFTFETARITRNTATPFNQYDFGMKYDFILSSKNTLNARYLFQDGVTKNANGSSAGYEIDIPFRSQNVGATFTRQLSSRQLNEVRFDYGRLAVAFEGANTFPISQIGQNIARFTMPSGFLNFGLATNLPQNRKVNTYQFVDNWSMVAGRNTFKAGVDVRRQLTPVAFLPQINGAFSFNSVSRFARNTPTSFSGSAGNLILDIKETDVFLYFQDDIKVKPNFTLNLGIRWEYTGQPLNVVHDITTRRESDPSTAFFNPAVPIGDRTVAALDAPKKNFAPRFGFAYQPRWGKRLFGEGKTTIRGGYSIAYDPAFFNLLLNVSTAAPTVFLYTLNGPVGNPPGTVTVPANVTGASLSSAFTPPLGTADPRFLNQTRFDPSFRSPYAENWTFGIQRQIRGMALEVRYAGSRGVRLYQSRNDNPLISGWVSAGFGSLLPPGVTPSTTTCTLPSTDPRRVSCGRVNGNQGRLRVRGNTAASTYHGLQTELRGKMWNQLNHGLSYTYSHNIDNVSEVFTFAGSGSTAFSQNPFDVNQGERGNSNIDLKHVIAYNFIWEVPWRKSQQGVLGHIFGGWELSGIYRWATGRPMTPVCFFCGSPIADVSFANAFVGTFETTRPYLSNPSAPLGSVGIYTSTGLFVYDVNVGATTTATTPAQVQFIIPNARAAAVQGTPFGIGRNILRGQHFNRGDFAVFKNNKIGERLGVQFRWEVRNIFNQPFLNGGIPDIFVDDASSAFADSSFLNLANSAGFNTTTFPRQMTFGLRFTF